MGQDSSGLRGEGQVAKWSCRSRRVRVEVPGEQAGNVRVIVRRAPLFQCLGRLLVSGRRGHTPLLTVIFRPLPQPSISP
jgi:hypothetical protein